MTNINNKDPRGSVLIVDDNPNTKLALAALLEERFSVTMASSSAEAIVTFENQPTDVVVTDFEMPNGTGIELINTLSKRYPKLVGLLITGHAEHPEVKQAKENPKIFMILKRTYRPEFISDWIAKAVRFSQLSQPT
jgi:DNA-binding NtrC family response regulator